MGTSPPATWGKKPVKWVDGWMQTSCLDEWFSPPLVFAVDRSGTTGPVNAGCIVMMGSVCTNCFLQSFLSFLIKTFTWRTYPTPEGCSLKMTDSFLYKSQENSGGNQNILLKLSECFPLGFQVLTSFEKKFFFTLKLLLSVVIWDAFQKLHLCFSLQSCLFIM